MGSSRSSFYCSSSSASPPQIKYDVYLSFRGEDTRYNFHLLKALNDRGINTFVDWELNRGDEVSQSLIRAIEESWISLIIFSENNASSGWCLQELAKILEGKDRETNKLRVISAFYKIMPSDVRKQTGSFAYAFAMHEQRFKEYLEPVHRLEDAVREAAYISGWSICGDESEAEFVDKNTQDVFSKLNFMLSNDDGNCFNCNGRFRRRIMSWERGELLGRGSVGAVYEGITNDGAFIAVKEVSLMDQSTQGKQSILQLEQEILLLSEFEHENIVRYFGAQKVENKLYIFLELVTKGSVETLYGKYVLNDSQVSAYTRQILNGLKYLHDRNVVHRDIKCANILVDASGSAKLADFGLAKAIDTNGAKSCKGTPFWMAPEVVNPKNHGYGLAADIWSLGCTVLEMLTRRRPYYGWESMQALFQIGQGNPPPLPDDLSRDAEDFILKCIQVNPNDRPTAAQLLDHPFIKEHCE